MPPRGRKPELPDPADDGEPIPERATVVLRAPRPRGGAGRPESTVLLDTRQRELPKAQAKLIGVRGRWRALQFPLSGTELSLGREPSNDIVLADISVARRHARLRRVPDGWLIAKAAEGAGSRVNGLVLEEEVLLHDGDIVEVGGAELRFVEVKPAQEPAAASVTTAVRGPAPAFKLSPRLQRALVVFTAVMAVLAVSTVLLRGGARVVRQRLSVGPQVDDFALARTLILAQKWSEAKVELLKAQNGNPRNPEIQRYLDTVAVELSNQRHLDAAQAALAKRDLAGALSELRPIGEGSLLADAAGALKVKVEAAVSAQVQRASEAIAAQDLGLAKELLDQALAAEPGQPQALALLPRLNGQLAVARVTAEEAERSRKEREQELRLENGPVGQARRLFQGGDVDAALAMAKQAGGAEVVAGEALAARLAAFAEARQRGRRALSGHDAVALAMLEQAYRLAVEIGGREASPTVAVGQQVAQLHDQQGMQARSARAMDRAYRHFEAALEVNPADTQAHDQLQRLESEAEDLYHTAYGQVDTDPAAALRNLRLVVQMTGSSSAWHQKAEERLKRLSSSGKATP